MRADPPSRHVILTFVRHYLPGYKAGGPLRTIANMVEALGDEYDFRIVTLDRDATEAAAYPDMEEGVWTPVGKAKVFYLAPTRSGLARIAKILCETPHDILYLNSFFDPDFTLKPLLARRLGVAPRVPVVLAPRGEFSPAALRIKGARKRAFLAAAGVAGLHRDVRWQASSVAEQNDIRRTFGRLASRIVVAPDMPDTMSVALPGFVPRAQGAPLRICFLSRIAPMKSLDFALEILRDVAVPVRFDIHGPIEDEAYWKRCQEIARTLPDTVCVTYRGSIPHTDVPATLACHDLFFLPSRGENFGHAIFEALSAGTPVLISDQTPWRGLAERGVGWDLCLEGRAAFGRAVFESAGWTPAQQAECRRRCIEFAEEQERSEGAIEAIRALFAPSRREPLQDPVGYHDALAPGWNARYARGGFARRARFFERKILPLLPGGAWLDAGCGSGTFSRILAGQGRSVIGLDASLAMLAEAKAARTPANLSFMPVETVERLPFADGSFDGLLCLSVLEYLEDPLAVLAEMARVLRPGGVAVFSVPHRRSVVRRAQKVCRRLKPARSCFGINYLDLSRFETVPEEMQAHAVAAGFTPRTILGFDPIIPLVLRAALKPSLIYMICERGP